MSFKVGIVGLPNVGKSTLFKALTRKKVDISNYPFTTINPNVGIVTVPDERLAKLAKLYQSPKITPTVIEFIDIAGLVKGASKGEGLGNKFLANIREVDAVIHVVRQFSDKNVAHVFAEVDPSQDLGVIQTELALADLETVKRRLENVEGEAKSGNKEAKLALIALRKYQTLLDQGRLAQEAQLSVKERATVQDLNLLTAKPFLYALNVDESKAAATKKDFPALAKLAVPVLCISAKIEAEIAELAPAEAQAYLKDLGLQESGLARLIKISYQLLNLITYLTAGPKEAHAWTVTRGTRAPAAAGKIHSDFEKGFIKAEVINWQDFVKADSEAAAREQGLMRTEGKEYVVKDGDVVLFKFKKS